MHEPLQAMLKHQMDPPYQIWPTSGPTVYLALWFLYKLCCKAAAGECTLAAQAHSDSSHTSYMQTACSSPGMLQALASQQQPLLLLSCYPCSMRLLGHHGLTCTDCAQLREFRHRMLMSSTVETL